MHAQSRISVIIPCYNTESYLEECLSSVIHQTFRDIEIIVINDGSTDHSFDIISRYAEKDSRFIVINRENKGYSHTLNEGIKRAQSAYIAFLDSDDYYERNYLSTVYEAAVKHNLDLAITNYVNFWGGGWNRKQELLPAAGPGGYNQVFRGTDKEVFRKFTHCWRTLHRRSLLVEHQIFFNEEVLSCSDNGFYVQETLLADRIMYIDYAGVFHRKSNPNAMTKNVDFMFRDFFSEKAYIVEKLMERNLWEQNKEKVIQRFFYNFHFALMRIPFEQKFSYVLKMAEMFQADLTAYGKPANGGLSGGVGARHIHTGRWRAAASRTTVHFSDL